MNFITRHLDEKYINLKCDFSKKKAAIKFEQEFKFLPVGFPKLEKKYVFLSRKDVVDDISASRIILFDTPML